MKNLILENVTNKSLGYCENKHAVGSIIKINKKCYIIVRRVLKEKEGYIYYVEANS